MGKIFYLLWLSLFCGVLSAVDFDLGNEIAQMQSIGKPQKIGESVETGYYIICIENIVVSDEINDDMAKELGLAQAKRTIAGFFNTKVDSSITQSKETTLTTKGENETAVMQEMTKEFTQIDVNQLLKGVIVYKAERKGGSVEVICFFSQKVADATNEMKKAVDILPANTVQAVGISLSEGNNIDAVRNNALQAAKRQAIEQVLGTSVASTTQVQDSDKVRAKIFATSNGFIETYRVVEESSVAGGYRVVIVATVAKDKLLSDYSALVKAMGDPGFFVRADNQELYMTFVKFFTGLGLKLVAQPEAADYIIDAIGEYRQLKHPASGYDGVQLSLWIRIFDAKSNQELLSQKNDPKQSAVFYSNGERQKDIATEKAFAQIKEPLHRELNKLIGKMVANGRPVQLVINNYSDAFASELTIIENIVKMIPGSSSSGVKIDATCMQASFSLNYAGSMEDFESFLRTAMQKEIQGKARIPKTITISANRLELSF